MRVVLAAMQREYTAKLADYLREEEPNWDIAAFTHESALRRELQGSGVIDLLIGQIDMLLEVASLSDRVGKIVALVEERDKNRGGKWQEVVQYQPLPAILSGIRGGLSGGNVLPDSSCQVVTLFSASGGVGKTTVALNLIRQAGERGVRTFYLNLEALNATSLLFGKGEPDSLSRLLYSLQAYPEKWGEMLKELCRHQPQLRTDYLDATDHPGERLALTSELMMTFIEGLKATGKYDLIVIDPDSGAGDWHCSLVQMSDRVIWLTADDAQLMLKTEKLLNHWHNKLGENMSKIIFALNKGNGSMVNRWNLPGGKPSATLPYIPQWKTVDQPGRLLGSPAYCGAVEQLLALLRIESSTVNTKRRREEGHGIQRSHIRGAC
ncbi:nucleotide-binding protein [Cohnella abietis]|uniref:CobQ/CobB/MinD/ParA nucleotide binding domain-containing protein n=1 Tax=Cohnella abietis TaxID=2507935 RepID=A0A3T1D1P0_9BACL|nr:tyrosine-protein kinase family protein [Cohnella abietis]BBI32004.1 hypothetical protein KCTCHS21_14030 [Cohnella abietis]